MNTYKTMDTEQLTAKRAELQAAIATNNVDINAKLRIYTGTSASAEHQRQAAYTQFHARIDARAELEQVEAELATRPVDPFVNFR